MGPKRPQRSLIPSLPAASLAKVADVGGAGLGCFSGCNDGYRSGCHSGPHIQGDGDIGNERLAGLTRSLDANTLEHHEARRLWQLAQPVH